MPKNSVQPSISAAAGQNATVDAQNGAIFTFGLDRSSLPDLDRLAAEQSLRAGKRVEGTNVAIQFGSALRPVDQRLGLFDLVRVSHAFGRLRFGRQWQLAQRLDDQRGAQRGQTVVQRRRGIARFNWKGTAQQHRASIQPGLHLHDADTRCRIAGQQGALNRCCTTPTRQK